GRSRGSTRPSITWWRRSTSARRRRASPRRERRSGWSARTTTRWPDRYLARADGLDDGRRDHAEVRARGVRCGLGLELRREHDLADRPGYREGGLDDRDRVGTAADAGIGRTPLGVGDRRAGRPIDRSDVGPGGDDGRRGDHAGWLSRARRW